jgi:hypothetical protein
MVTVEQLRSPSSVSGFRHVGKSTGPKPYQAVTRYARGLTGSRAVGTRRATAEEAAQDYCDYLNNGRSEPVVNLASAGHKQRRRAPGAHTGRISCGVPGYVYCIGEESRNLAVKIGYAQDAEFRIADLQTGNPRKLVLLGVLRGTVADERDLHAKYIADNVLGEWFRPTAELLSEFDIDPESVLA